MMEVLLYIMIWVAVSTATYIIAKLHPVVDEWSYDDERSIVIGFLSAVWPIGLPLFGTIWLVHKVLAKVGKEKSDQ